MKKPDFIARKFLFPCTALLSFTAFFLAASSLTIWWNWPWLWAQPIWLSAIVAAIAVALLWSQLLYLPKFLRFVSSNFEAAHPRWSLVLTSHLHPAVLIFAIAFAIGAVFWSEYFAAFLAFYVLAAAVDIVILATLLGLGLYWQRLGKRQPAEAQAEIVRESDTTGFVPVGIVCQLDVTTGEMRMGMMMIDPNGSGKMVVSDMDEASPDGKPPIIIQQDDADDSDNFHP